MKVMFVIQDDISVDLKTIMEILKKKPYALGFSHPFVVAFMNLSYESFFCE